MLLLFLAHRRCFVALLLAMTALAGFPTAAPAAEGQDCVRPELVLWGDGRHDDTMALDGWWHGAGAIWAASGQPVGATIAGRSFRLSGAIYVPGGTGRRMEDFHLVWPERGETVSGGTIATGSDPDAAPSMTGVTIEGGDSGEGKPFEAPDAAPGDAAGQRSCAIS